MNSRLSKALAGTLTSAPRPAIGRPAPVKIEDAGHFLQEDQGPLIGRLIADWLTAG